MKKREQGNGLDRREAFKLESRGSFPELQGRGRSLREERRREGPRQKGQQDRALKHNDLVVCPEKTASVADSRHEGGSGIRPQ